MPLGDFIAETVGQAIVEVVFYGITYWTGFVILKAVSFGRLELAPLSTLHERNPGKRKWYQVDWSIWLVSAHGARQIRAEAVIVVGMLFWVALGAGLFFLMIAS